MYCKRRATSSRERKESQSNDEISIVTIILTKCEDVCLCSCVIPYVSKYHVRCVRMLTNQVPENTPAFCPKNPKV